MASLPLFNIVVKGIPGPSAKTGTGREDKAVTETVYIGAGIQRYEQHLIVLVLLDRIHGCFTCRRIARRIQLRKKLIRLAGLIAIMIIVITRRVGLAGNATHRKLSEYGSG